MSAPPQAVSRYCAYRKICRSQQKRFCGAEGIENVMTASAFRDSFGEDYGITIAE